MELRTDADDFSSSVKYYVKQTCPTSTLNAWPGFPKSSTFTSTIGSLCGFDEDTLKTDVAQEFLLRLQSSDSTL